MYDVYLLITLNCDHDYYLETTCTLITVDLLL